MHMAVKQNAADFSLEFPAAVKAVDESFYVDDDLSGAVDEAITLQRRLHIQEGLNAAVDSLCVGVSHAMRQMRLLSPPREQIIIPELEIGGALASQGLPTDELGRKQASGGTICWVATHVVPK